MVEPNRILIVRPSALGDVCRTVPVLATLRHAFPRATIHWMVQEEYAGAITAHPALDEAVSFPRQRFARWWRNPAVAWEMLGWFASLPRRGYDLAIDCQGLGRSGLITWATRARRRVGPRSARELGWLGYTTRHSIGPARHAVEQMMCILKAEGLEPVYDMRLYLGDDDRVWWSKRRAELGMTGRPYAVLAPTCRWPTKRWPSASWSALIGPLVERGFGWVVLVGSPAERGQVEELVDPTTANVIVDLVGRTSLGRAMAVIADAAVVIAHDSAPVHMAVGFARPCLGLYGPTDPAVVGPYGAAESALRAYVPRPGRLANFKDGRMGDALMRMIRPVDVLDRVDRILDAARRESTPPLAGGQPEVGSNAAERAAS
jgi:lipopolysaccharide heptosyltransferase I